MNTRIVTLIFALPLAAAFPVHAAQQPEAPPPVTQIRQAPVPAAPPTSEMQRVYGPVGLALIAPNLVQTVVDRFQAAYGSPKSPRIVVYINRALIDTKPEPQPASGTDSMGKNAKGRQAAKSAPANTVPAPTVADLQTMREIERLFGRVFRAAGVQLVDQPTAVALLSETPGERLVGDKADRQRQALLGVADVAIEVLVTSRNLVVPGISSDDVVSVPDIQTTAIRLKDSAIIGQASASDVLGKDRTAGQLVKTFDVRDITEATAIALMQDMLTVAK